MISHFDDFYCFAVVVEHGGFSAAERATDIPKSKLSRRILNLEQYLGVRLIHRNSRQFSVTDMGMKIYEQAKIMLNAAQAAQDIVHKLSETPRGTVKISTPTSIAQNELAKILPNFLKQYPEIQIQLLVSNRRYDVINEGIDIALRVRSQLDNDTGLIVRRFAKIQQHLCASQAYLNQFGTPRHPDELAQHRLLSMMEHVIRHDLELNSNHGESFKIKIEPHVLGLDFVMLNQLAKEDCGIVLLPDSISADAIQSGELVYVLPEWHAPHGIFHMVYPSRQGILPAVKVFIDYLVEQLTETDHII
ncbi:LysR family transcriptional regulator [Acinetobacter populi]|jgi:DNA-binding transcriptional LysR family regulator|uniref:LysR family transcriptional regulator n=1 Tax=Acinetobacter populi TaxID=1582270 RepID=A0A1Z9YZ08_9GAMM|nr:LysR family transcriptional regulator [Acinetobacter populi]MCH4248212.1 LysR family transcriptional regulator [Acinetobacter populi]OUY07454.1 LysR family transcriptional regulator [Acinetobacter populi]